jgi:hypothetical protein
MLRQVLIETMVALASAKNIVEMNIAAGIAAQRLEELDGGPNGPVSGQVASGAPKAI